MTGERRDPLERPAGYESYPESPYWPRFIEKLLLAIINAYPDPSAKTKFSQEQSRHKRLGKAMKALILTSKRGNRRLYDLEHDIKLALEQSEPRGVNGFNEKFGIPHKREFVPGSRTVFKSQAPTDGQQSEESFIGRIKKKRSDKKIDTYCKFIVRDNIHREEDDMMEALREISVILARFNIDLDIDPKELAMASHWPPHTGRANSEN